MGSEQSSQDGGSQNRDNPRAKSGQLRRGKSVPNRERVPDEETPPRCTSPGPSICSDSDLPYISYTVNRPIGDSPKMNNKQSQLVRGKLSSQDSSRRRSSIGIIGHRKSTNDKLHNIVVVKPAAANQSTDKDPDLQKLQSIPMFLPIMRGTLNLPPGVRDPEVLERLDPIGLFNLCARYQHHLNNNAQMIASEQLTLCNSNLDSEVNRLVQLADEKQKKFTKLAEQLNKVHELSRQLNKCHLQLNQTLESLETLNNLLPMKDRLEPFVWTTG